MKNVRIIPAIPKKNKKLRVAGYCLVSTSGSEQLRSLEIQIKTYTKMIRGHKNWIYAGVFYDIESGLRRMLHFVKKLIVFKFGIAVRRQVCKYGHYTFWNF